MNLRAPRLHESDELIEEIPAVVGPGGGFRMILHREDGPLPVRDSLHRTVVQVDVREPKLRRSRNLVALSESHRESVILRRDLHGVGVEVPYRVVPTVMAERKLVGLCASRKSEQLVAREMSWWPRQIPKTGTSRADSSRIAASACSTAEGSPGPLETNMPSGR